jgi:hypothetical protein
MVGCRLVMFELMIMCLILCVICLGIASFVYAQKSSAITSTSAAVTRGPSVGGMTPSSSSGTATSIPSPMPKVTWVPSLTATNCKDLRPAANAVEETLRLYVQQRGREFVTYLKNSKHANDPRAQAAIISWAGFVHIFSEAGARFNRSTGCLYINPSVQSVTRARMNTKFLHELAHSICCGHDTKWQSAFKYFLGIATQELGWICDVECGICTKYGICSKSDCPKCTWINDPATCPLPHYRYQTCSTNCED